LLLFPSIPSEGFREFALPTQISFSLIALQKFIYQKEKR